MGDLIAIPARRGKAPDMEAIASSIVYSTQASHLRWTMVDGRMLYRNGAVATIPRAKLLEDTTRAQLKIARALGR